MWVVDLKLCIARLTFPPSQPWVWESKCFRRILMPRNILMPQKTENPYDFNGKASRDRKTWRAKKSQREPISVGSVDVYINMYPYIKAYLREHWVKILIPKLSNNETRCMPQRNPHRPKVCQQWIPKRYSDHKKNHYGQGLEQGGNKEVQSLCLGVDQKSIQIPSEKWAKRFSKQTITWTNTQLTQWWALCQDIFW